MPVGYGEVGHFTVVGRAIQADTDRGERHIPSSGASSRTRAGPPGVLPLRTRCDHGQAADLSNWPRPPRPPRLGLNQTLTTSALYSESTPIPLTPCRLRAQIAGKPWNRLRLLLENPSVRLVLRLSPRRIDRAPLAAFVDRAPSIRRRGIGTPAGKRQRQIRSHLLGAHPRSLPCPPRRSSCELGLTMTSRSMWSRLMADGRRRPWALVHPPSWAWSTLARSRSRNSRAGELDGLGRQRIPSTGSA